MFKILINNRDLSVCRLILGVSLTINYKRSPNKNKLFYCWAKISNFHHSIFSTLITHSKLYTPYDKSILSYKIGKAFIPLLHNNKFLRYINTAILRLGLPAKTSKVGGNSKRKGVGYPKIKNPSLINVKSVANTKISKSSIGLSKSKNPTGINNTKRTGAGKNDKALEKPKILQGQIGDAKLCIFGPFIYDQLKGKHPLADLNNAIDKMVEFHDNLIKNHGIKEGTKVFKEITLYSTQLLEGLYPKPLFNVSIGKVDRWPKALSFLRPFYHIIRDYSKKIILKDPNDKADKSSRDYVLSLRRFMLILFKINRVCKQYSNLDVFSLAKKHKLNPVTINEFTKFVNLKLGEDYPTKNVEAMANSDIKILFGPAKGPNGLPKADSSNAEAYKICNSDDKVLLESLETLVSRTQDSYFIDYLQQCSDLYDQDNCEELANPEYERKTQKVDPIILRKLISIPDKGNKSRVIALCDFWTQSVLGLIEGIVLKTTMSLYRDNCSYYSHSDGFEKIKNLEPGLMEQLLSLDATEWTDNLPASLQVIVMSKLFGTDISNAWKNLAVLTPWNIGNSSDTVTYGKGQGMGTKGSFAIAQLTNLLFIGYLYQKHYRHISQPFFMEVGDDMVLQDPEQKFAAEFEAIGVPINLSKTKRNTPYGSFVEFVSRNCWGSDDYSIVSPSLMLKYRKNDFYILPLIVHLNERGINLSIYDLFKYKFKENTLFAKDVDEELLRSVILATRRNIFFIAHLFNLCSLTQNGVKRLDLGISSDELNSLFSTGEILEAIKQLLLLKPYLAFRFMEESSQLNTINYSGESDIANGVFTLDMSGCSEAETAYEEQWTPMFLRVLKQSKQLGLYTELKFPETLVHPICKVDGLDGIQSSAGSKSYDNRTYTLNPQSISDTIMEIFSLSAASSDVKVARNKAMLDTGNMVPYSKLMAKLNRIFKDDLTVVRENNLFHSIVCKDKEYSRIGLDFTTNHFSWEMYGSKGELDVIFKAEKACLNNGGTPLKLLLSPEPIERSLALYSKAK